jgi:DNA repair exonuclease SbcCD ATPase subunit
MTQNTKSKATHSSVEQDIGELRKRVEWLDEERRKSLRKMAELEQKTILQERELASRERRILDLEKQLAQVNNQLSRIPMVDTQLSQFRDDIVKMIEQYDKRRIEADRELDRLRRVEHESTTREVAEIRKEIQGIGRLEEAIPLRQAEEARLAALIGGQQNSLTQIVSQLDGLEQSYTFLEQKEKQDNRNIAEIQAALLDISKKWEPINNRIEIIGQNLMKVQTSAQATSDAQTLLKKSINDWTEQVQIGEHERNQRLIGWQRTMDEHDTSLARFTQDWVKFNNQYNESRTAIETIRNFQEHLEQLQREANEMVRVESQRMEGRWIQFVDEDSRKWKNFEADSLQRQAINDRRERELREHLQGLEEQLDSLQQDIAQVLRIQTAQSEAIKKWPLTWLEEVEKAVEQNPNRRRQPTLVPIREE